MAHLTIPKDIQELTVDEGARSPANIAKHSARPLPAPHPARRAEQLQQAAAHDQRRARRSAILAGRGCLGARERGLTTGRDGRPAPIIKPLLGKAVVPDDSPYTTGGIGLLGTAPSQDALSECDTLHHAGTSFPYMEFLPKPGQAQVGADRRRPGADWAASSGRGRAWSAIAAPCWRRCCLC